MRLTAIAVCLLAFAAPAAAQDYDATPNYGEISLQAGFTPDPGLIVVQAGGSLSASDHFDSCQGYISDAPDVRLHWSGSGKGSSPLKISAVSNADTTLVINGPNGEWYCNDDDGEDSNPSLTLTPTNGRYEIWIGTYTSGETKNAVLSISEVTSF